MTPRIEICGNIASGKTTLCDHLTSTVKSLSIFENFQDNPFYEAFYDDPIKNAFETELTFLLQHYHLIKSQPINTTIVCDYSILLDVAYADTNLLGNRLRLFLEIVDELQQEIGFPNYLIHLICPENVLLDRIIARSREAETSITIGYLESITKALQKRVAEIASKAEVITINSDAKDFRDGLKGISELESLLEIF